MLDTESPDFVGSFARGLSVIESFNAEAKRQTLTEVATSTGLSRAAARRFLLTLMALGYARSDGKHFELTPAVLKLGFSYLSGLDLWELTQPILSGVTQDLNESCSVAVLDGHEIAYVARSAAGHRIVSISLRIGTRLPVHATSMGHVLLAGMPTADLADYLRTAPFERFTGRTLCTAQQLSERLTQVSEGGYAMCDGELETGLRSLAVPIHATNGRVIAAVNISTHTARVPADEIENRYLPRLKKAAEEIEVTLRMTSR